MRMLRPAHAAITRSQFGHVANSSFPRNEFRGDTSLHKERWWLLQSFILPLPVLQRPLLHRRAVDDDGPVEQDH